MQQHFLKLRNVLSPVDEAVISTGHRECVCNRNLKIPNSASAKGAVSGRVGLAV